MRIGIVKEGLPFIGTALSATVIIDYTIGGYWSIPTAVLMLFFAFFFRSPKRSVPADPNVIVSPADGRVMAVQSETEELFMGEVCQKVTIFLSVFDVHVNRAPIAGEIKFRQYTVGGFRPAYKKTVGFENERHTIALVNERLTVVVTQIAGILARRIVSWKKLGDNLDKGELYGMIKFGSCTEVFLPQSVEVCVRQGDKVVGGETIIGRIQE